MSSFRSIRCPVFPPLQLNTAPSFKLNDTSHSPPATGSPFHGVTEQLKAENQMEWVRQMNACKAQAEEVVKAELIYD